MPVTNYHTMNGEIIGETTNGVRTDYLTDALGSVTATMNQSAQIINTYRYKPFGALLAKTGTGADPAFGWVGSQGYRQTNKKFSNFYVRRRHYDTNSGRWDTLDRLGAQELIENQYLYAYANPILWQDRTGQQPNCQTTDCCVGLEPDPKLYKCKMGSWKDCPTKEKDKGYQWKDLCDSLRTDNPKLYCQQILEALKDALVKCSYFCEHGRYGGGGGPSIVDAVTLCCCQNGSSKYCRTVCCEEFLASAPKNPCRAYCISQHEDTHRKLECDSHLPCMTNRDVGDKGSECCAHRKEVECLWNMYRNSFCWNSSMEKGKLIARYNECDSSSKEGFTKCSKSWR